MTLRDHQDLMFDDGVPMENDEHGVLAMYYLREPLQTWLEEQGRRAFISSNSAVHYDPECPPVGPDFYVVLDAVPRRRKGWVVWREGGLKPCLVVEMLSPTTEDEDRGRKFLVYRDRMQVPDYFLHNSDTGRLEGFHRVGNDYVPVLPDSNARLSCTCLPLSLGILEGHLRLFTEDGAVLPTARERADAAERRVGELEERLRRLEGDG